MLDDERVSELETFACKGDADGLRRVVDGDDFDASSEAAVAAVRGAAEAGHWEALRYLVEDARVEVRSPETGGLSLQYAALAGRLDVLRMLVANGAQLKSSAGSKAIRSAAATGNLEVLRFVVEGGADVETDGCEAAWAAALACHWEAVEYIVRAGADVVASDGGVRLVALAAARGQGTLVELLKGYGVEAPRSDAGSRALMSLSSPAWWNECADAVRYLVANGVDTTSAAGGAALVTAAMYGDLDMVRCLVDSGASVETAAAGQAVARAGELGPANATQPVVDFLMERGAVPPPPPVLVTDADF